MSLFSRLDHNKYVGRQPNCLSHVRKPFYALVGLAMVCQIESNSWVQLSLEALFQRI